MRWVIVFCFLLTLQSYGDFSGQCNWPDSLSVHIQGTYSVVQVEDLNWAFPSPPELKSLFDISPSSEDFLPNTNSLNTPYTFQTQILPHRKNKKYFKVVIESKEQFVVQGTIRKYLNTWLPPKTLPIKKYEVFVLSEDFSSEPSHIFVRIYAPKLDHSKLQLQSEKYCLI